MKAPMAGHNKWTKVKRIKGPLDAKRGKLFTKLIKEITVAAKMGGGSPDGNPRLRQAIQLAKEASMPKDNIERAIKKGTGELAGEAIEEALYEGYGPGGVAVLVEATTDNRNRTVNDMRLLFRGGGGNLADAGSVAWMFERHGQLVFDKKKHSEDLLMEVALEAGAQDVSPADDTVEVLTEPGEVYKVKEDFDRVGMHPTSVGFSYVPKTTVPVTEREAARKLLAFLEELEDHDDVTRVHANFDIDDALLASLSDR
jgi:YebC/PmpR family DNA-binding regulatory protein